MTNKKLLKARDVERLENTSLPVVQVEAYRPDPCIGVGLTHPIVPMCWITCIVEE